MYKKTKFCVNTDTHTDCTESTDEPNSALLLEVFKRTLISQIYTNSPVDFAA